MVLFGPWAAGLSDKAPEEPPPAEHQGPIRHYACRLMIETEPGSGMCEYCGSPVERDD